MGNNYSPKKVSGDEEALVEVPVLTLKEETGFVPTGELIKSLVNGIKFDSFKTFN